MKTLQFSGIQSIWLNEKVGEIQVWVGDGMVPLEPAFALSLLNFLELHRNILEAAVYSSGEKPIHVQVEYDRSYFGGVYTFSGEIIHLWVVSESEIGYRFEQETGLSRENIVCWETIEEENDSNEA